MFESIIIFAIVIVVLIVVAILVLKYGGLESAILFLILFGASIGIQLINGLISGIETGDFSLMLSNLSNPVVDADISILSNFWFGLVRILLWFLIFLMIAGVIGKGFKRVFPSMKNKYFSLFFPLVLGIVLLFCIGEGLPNFSIFMFSFIHTNPLMFAIIIIIIVVVIILYLKYGGKQINEEFEGKHTKLRTNTVSKSVMNIFNNIGIMSEEYVKTMFEMAQCVDDFSNIEYYNQMELYDFLRDNEVKGRDILNASNYIVIKRLNVEIYKLPKKYALLFVHSNGIPKKE